MKNKKLEDFYDLATKAQAAFSSAYKDNFDMATKCSQWVFGVQEWSRSDIKELRRYKETATANFINKYYKKVLAELTQSEVSLSVQPVGNAKTEHVKVNKQLIEQILLSSDNQKVFHDLLDSCLTKGFGVAKISVAYETGDSMNRVLKVSSLRNLTGCFFDLSANSLCMEDGRFCGQKNEVKLSKLFNDHGVDPALYGNSEFVTVFDFYYKKSAKTTFYKTSAGIWKSEKSLSPSELARRDRFKSSIRNVNEIWFARFTEKEFLIKPGLFYYGNSLPMLYWPVCTDLVQVQSSQGSGNAADHQIKRVASPFVKPLLGVQECYNYALSQATTLLANAIGTKWIVTPEQISGFEKYWANINTLEGPISINQSESGTQVQVITNEPIHQTLLNFMEMMKSAFNELSGIYELSQGADDSTISGVAADIKVSQANASNAVYLQKHVGAINCLGKVLSGLVVSFYTEKRIFFLDNNEVCVVNEVVYQNNAFVVKNSIKDIFNKSHILVASGAPARQDRKYNVNVLTTLMQNQNFSQHLPMFADILLENLDVTNKDLLVRRMQSMLGPDLFKISNGEMTLEEYFNQQITQEKAAGQQQAALQQIEQQLATIEAELKQSKTELQQAKAAEAMAKAQLMMAEARLAAPANPAPPAPAAPA